MIYFNNSKTREERWKEDRFAAFCEFFENINQACVANMAPDGFLAIDETLYPTCGGTSFKEYIIPNENNIYINVFLWSAPIADNPAKYGLNFRSLGHACRGYIRNTTPYCGKPQVVTPADIMITDTFVRRIVEGYELYGHKLRGTTSIPLANWMFDKK